MEFEPEEEALIRIYSRRDAVPSRRWVGVLVLGVLLVLGSVVVLAMFTDLYAAALLGIMAGIVVVSQAMDDRNKRILAAVIQKYRRVTGEPPPEEETGEGS